MKFFIAFALIATVASAAVKPVQVNSEIADIVAAIQSPSTDPATAAALEALLLDVLGVQSPVVGPAIIESNPISVGPAIVDFPMPDGGAVSESVVNPSPAVVAPVAPAADSTPLVQIILNINQASAESAPGLIPVSPVMVEEVAEEAHAPGPVNVVDHVIAPEPVVVAPVIVEPVQVVEPIVVEPVQVGTPIIPAPAVVLPEILN